MSVLHEPIVKFKYPVVVRLTGLIGISIIATSFLISPRFVHETILESIDQVVITTEEIPQTTQINRPPPVRPSIPYESESAEIAEDLTIAKTDFKDFEINTAPPIPIKGPGDFIPYDDPPVALGKISPRYPEIAQAAGIEGMVVIKAFIDKKGRVIETIVLKGIPNTGLDEAAADAIKAVHWRPAKQRDKAVGVWIAIPVIFKLQ